MSPVSSLLRVIIYVQDMATQVHFYRNVLGLELAGPEVDDYSDHYWVEFATGSCSLTLHGGGQGRLGADAPKLAFGVDDMEGARQALAASGVTLGEVRSPTPGVLVCDGRDPEGNSFSLDYHAH